MDTNKKCISYAELHSEVIFSEEKDSYTSIFFGQQSRSEHACHEIQPVLRACKKNDNKL